MSRFQFGVGMLMVCLCFLNITEIEISSPCKPMWTVSCKLSDGQDVRRFSTSNSCATSEVMVRMKGLMGLLLLVLSKLLRVSRVFGFSALEHFTQNMHEKHAPIRYFSKVTICHVLPYVKSAHCNTAEDYKMFWSMFLRSLSHDHHEPLTFHFQIWSLKKEGLFVICSYFGNTIQILKKQTLMIAKDLLADQTVKTNAHFKSPSKNRKEPNVSSLMRSFVISWMLFEVASRLILSH